MKVVLRFREAFWKDLTIPGEGSATADLKEFTFLHAPQQPLPLRVIKAPYTAQ